MAESVNWREKCETLESENKRIQEDYKGLREMNYALNNKLIQLDGAEGRSIAVGIVLSVLLGLVGLNYVLKCSRGHNPVVATSANPAIVTSDRSDSVPVSNDPAPEAEKPQDVAGGVLPSIAVDRKNLPDYIVFVFGLYSRNDFVTRVEYYCTGTVVNESGKDYVIISRVMITGTAADGGYMAANLFAVTSDGKTRGLTPLFWGDRFAVCEFSDKSFKFAGTPAVLAEYENRPNMGQEVQALGFELPNTYRFPESSIVGPAVGFERWGMVYDPACVLEDKHGVYVLHNCKTDFGSGGGPFLNKKGEVAGINVWALDGPTPLTFSTSLSRAGFSDFVKCKGDYEWFKAKAASEEPVAPLDDLERFEGFKIEKAWDDLRVIKVEGAYMHLDDYCYEKCRGLASLPAYFDWQNYRRAGLARSCKPGGEVELAKECISAGDRTREDRQLVLVECWDEWQVALLKGEYGIVIHLTPELYEQVKQRKGADLTWLAELEKAQRIKELNEKYGEKR